MSIDIGSNTTSRILGPTAGGLLLATAGIHGAFTVSVALYVIAAISAIGIRYRTGIRAAAADSTIRRIVDGLKVVANNRHLAATLFITSLYNMFYWPFMSMIPVIGQDNLQLGAREIGILASMEGIGASVGALLIAFVATPLRYARIYIGGVFLCFVMQTSFAFLPYPLLAGACLILAGAGASGFVSMQTTLVYLAVPPEMRGRMLGVLSACIGVAPLGFLHIGLLADAMGAKWAAIMVGTEGLLILLLTQRFWRSIGDGVGREQPGIPLEAHPAARK